MNFRLHLPLLKRIQIQTLITLLNKQSLYRKYTNYLPVEEYLINIKCLALSWFEMPYYKTCTPVAVEIM